MGNREMPSGSAAKRDEVPFALPVFSDASWPPNGLNEFDIVDDNGTTFVWRISKASADALVTAVNSHEKLLAMVQRYAHGCRECYGQGRRMTHPAGVAEDCFACADIRALLTSCKGEGEK